MIWLVWSGRNSLSLPLRSTQTKGANLNMKILQVLTSSLFNAPAAFAQSPEKTKSAESASFPPIRDIHAHVRGIHFYSGDMSRPIIADHYGSQPPLDVLQFVIYDLNKLGARTIEVDN